MKVPFKVTNISLNTNQKELIKKLPKTYPPHGSPNNQKEQNHKETKSHGSPFDSTINHKETTSHGAHDISLCTMTKLWNPTPH